MSPVAAPADKRFRRAHVKPARRRVATRWLLVAIKSVVLAALALYGGYRGAYAVLHAGVLAIDRIVVSGNERLAGGEVRALLGGMQGEHIVWTDLEEWRQRLIASPWVKDASFRRWLPSTIEVIVSERKPLALGRIDGKLYLIDEDGVLIDQHGPKYADLDLPIVDGLTAPPTGRADERRAALAGRLIASLDAEPQLAARVSQVDVTDVRNASVILSGDPAVIYVGHDRFLPRLQAYVELADALRARVPDIDYVDLRIEDRIFVRPAGRGGKRQAVPLASGGGDRPEAGRHRW